MQSFPSPVPALDRSVAVIDYLCLAQQPSSLAALTKHLNIPKSSAHNLMAALTAHGLTRRDSNGNYALGYKVVQWGRAFNSATVLIAAFEQSVPRHPELSTETLMLAVLDKTDVAYLACHPGTRPLAVNFKVGGRFAASCTSSGKAILSSWPDERIAELYQSQDEPLFKDGRLPKLTRHSIANLPSLIKQMPSIRKQGYATDDEETAEGMQCFGAPVFAGITNDHENDRANYAVAGVAVSLIKASITAKRKATVVRAIKALAEDVSIALAPANAA